MKWQCVDCDCIFTEEEAGDLVPIANPEIEDCEEEDAIYVISCPNCGSPEKEQCEEVEEDEDE